MDKPVNPGVGATPTTPTTPTPATTVPTSPGQQRMDLLASERAAHQQQPRSFKDDALTDKVVSVQPDGTGPTLTDSFDPPADQAAEADATDAAATAARPKPAAAR